VPDLATAVYAFRSFIFPWSEFWNGAVGLLFMLPFAAFALWSLLFRSGWRSLVSQPVLFSALVIVAASFLWLNSRYDQAEGRYLFAAWPALILPLTGKPGGKWNLWLLLLCLLLPYTLMIIPVAGA